MKPQIITGRNGKPEFAVIPWAVWERVRPFAGSMSDEALYDAAKQRPSERFPADVANALLDGASPLKVLRQYRKMTQAELASAAGIAKLYLSQIETGRRTGSVETLRALARALKVDLDMIAPVENVIS
ncbi:MAG: helix-turn-helix transcriptional regulator [Alphaproteobacteria bacterium]|nr:helix-turn-helix transcriptional regulator [Alphaproteobacteria bacterium]